jgi:hypothetical protein
LKKMIAAKVISILTTTLVLHLASEIMSANSPSSCPWSSAY